MKVTKEMLKQVKKKICCPISLCYFRVFYDAQEICETFQSKKNALASDHSRVQKFFSNQTSRLSQHPAIFHFTFLIHNLQLNNAKCSDDPQLHVEIAL